MEAGRLAEIQTGHRPLWCLAPRSTEATLSARGSVPSSGWGETTVGTRGHKPRNTHLSPKLAAFTLIRHTYSNHVLAFLTTLPYTPVAGIVPVGIALSPFLQLSWRTNVDRCGLGRPISIIAGTQLWLVSRRTSVPTLRRCSHLGAIATILVSGSQISCSWGQVSEPLPYVVALLDVDLRITPIDGVGM